MESRARILHQLDATLEKIHTFADQEETQDKKLHKELLEKCLQDSIDAYRLVPYCRRVWGGYLLWNILADDSRWHMTPLWSTRGEKICWEVGTWEQGQKCKTNNKLKVVVVLAITGGVWRWHKMRPLPLAPSLLSLTIWGTTLCQAISQPAGQNTPCQLFVGNRGCTSFDNGTNSKPEQSHLETQPTVIASKMPTVQLSAISRLKRCATGKYDGICHEETARRTIRNWTKSTRLDRMYGSLGLSSEGKGQKIIKRSND